MSSPTPMFDAYRNTRELKDEFDGLTAEQVRHMPVSEYASRTGRPLTPAGNLDPVLADYTRKMQSREYMRNALQIEEDPTTEVRQPETQGVTAAQIKAMDTEQFAELRQQVGLPEYHGSQMSGSGKGIFDSVGSRSEAYTNATNAQAGRTGWVESNVVPSPAIARVSQVQVNESNLDHRPLAERFGNASNAYRYEG